MLQREIIKGCRIFLSFTTIRTFLEYYNAALRVAIKTKGAIYFHVLIYVQSPKLVLSLALIIDIFLLNRIALFYKMFYLGIIPLIVNLLGTLSEYYYNRE